jgi:uncharacterized membrane protein
MARSRGLGDVYKRQLQYSKLTCQQLTDDNYEKLGEYFMGQSIGNTQQHATMNAMIKSMRGEQGEIQMHISIGKRAINCGNTTSTQSGNGQSSGSFYPGYGRGFSMMGYGWPGMMGGWNGIGLLGWIPMVIFWILLILGIVVLVRFLGDSRKGLGGSMTSLDILKERYAKGEITKKEFEEMKKDISK